MHGDVTRMTVAIGDKPPATFHGREAWALANLIAAGQRGVTPLEQPAPRWSHYVFLLRRDGVNVETVTENHGGAFAGHHARYVLRAPVRVLETVRRVNGVEVTDREVAA